MANLQLSYTKSWIGEGTQGNILIKRFPSSDLYPGAGTYPMFDYNDRILYLEWEIDAIVAGRQIITDRTNMATDTITTVVTLATGVGTGTIQKLHWYGGIDATATIGTGILVATEEPNQVKAADDTLEITRIDQWESDVIELAGRSLSTTRAVGTIEAAANLAGRSASATRAFMELELITIALSGKSTSTTRNAISLETAIGVTGRSSSTTRSAAQILAAINLASKSITGTRADTAMNTLITISGRTSTATRTAAGINAAANLSLQTATETRTTIVLDTQVGIHIRSPSTTRATAEITLIWAITDEATAITDTQATIHGRGVFPAEVA